MTDALRALALGLLFGWSLQRAGLTRYGRIVGVFRLRDLAVLRFMLTALAVGAPLAQLGVALGYAERLPVPPTRALANLVGGAVFGVGMATAGYCPGTIAAEAGEGRLDALTAGLAGLVAGALAYGVAQPALAPLLGRYGDLGHRTLAELTGANPWLLLLVFVQLVALTLALLARIGRPTAP